MAVAAQPQFNHRQDATLSPSTNVGTGRVDMWLTGSASALSRYTTKMADEGESADFVETLSFLFMVWDRNWRQRLSFYSCCRLTHNNNHNITQGNNMWAKLRDSNLLKLIGVRQQRQPLQFEMNTSRWSIFQIEPLGKRNVKLATWCLF